MPEELARETFVLPNDPNKISKLKPFESEESTALYNRLTGDHKTPLFAMQVPGDGNCLLHSGMHLYYVVCSESLLLTTSRHLICLFRVVNQ